MTTSWVFILASAIPIAAISWLSNPLLYPEKAPAALRMEIAVKKIERVSMAMATQPLDTPHNTQAALEVTKASWHRAVEPARAAIAAGRIVVLKGDPSGISFIYARFTRLGLTAFCD